MKFSEFAKVMLAILALTVVVVLAHHLADKTKTSAPVSKPAKKMLRVVQLRANGDVSGEWMAHSVDLSHGVLRVYTNGSTVTNWSDWDVLISAPYRVTRE